MEKLISWFNNFLRPVTFESISKAYYEALFTEFNQIQENYYVARERFVERALSDSQEAFADYCAQWVASAVESRSQHWQELLAKAASYVSHEQGEAYKVVVTRNLILCAMLDSPYKTALDLAKNICQDCYAEPSVKQSFGNRTLLAINNAFRRRWFEINPSKSLLEQCEREAVTASKLYKPFFFKQHVQNQKDLVDFLKKMLLDEAQKAESTPSEEVTKQMVKPKVDDDEYLN